jgi:HK97 family phage portal protein
MAKQGWIEGWIDKLAVEARDFFSGFASAGISDFLPGMMLAPSESGVAVTEMTAIQVAAFVACIRILANSLGMLPLNVFQNVANGHKLAPEHDLYPVLHDQPNDEYSAVDIWTIAETHRQLSGNCYIEVIRDKGGRPRQLWIRSPFRTFPYRVQSNSSLIYKTTDTFNGNEHVILPENMIHVGNFGIDPWVGLSPVRYHMREVVGGAIAAQNWANRVYNNDATPSGVLMSKEIRTPTQKLQDAQQWIAAHSRSGAHSMAILDGDMKWEQISFDPEKLQMIATRGMQRDDIAAMFGVPPHFVGSNTSERSANLEQRFLEFLTMTLKPNLAKYEAEINRKLFNNVGRSAGKYFCKFDVSDFERADMQTTLKALQMGRYAGLYTIDEGRKMLKLDPIDPKTLNADNPGGSLWQPVNMVPVINGEVMEPTAGSPDTPDKSGNGGGPKGPSVAEQGPPEPKGPSTTGGSVTKQTEKKSARTLLNIFVKPMEDAITRVSARKKVNLADFERCFTPILCGIAMTEMPLDGEMIVPESVAGAIQSHCRGIYSRAQGWAKENPSSHAVEELNIAFARLLPIAAAAAEEESDDDSPTGAVKNLSVERVTAGSLRAENRAAEKNPAASPKNRVYILRHGQTALDPTKRSDGWVDLPLSDEGRQNVVQQMSDYMKHIPITEVHSSPLKRTEETGHILSSGLVSKPKEVSDPRLQTWDLGSLAGEKKTVAKPMVKDLLANPDKKAPDGGESYNDFTGRVDEPLEELMSNAAENGPLGAVLSGSVCRYLGEKLLGDRAALNIDEAGLVVLYQKNGKWTADVIAGKAANDEIS